MSILLDSSYFIAYADERDKYHSEAVRLDKKIREGEYGKILYTDYIFDETMTYILGKTKNINKTTELGEIILSGDFTKYNITTEIFDKAWKLFKQRKNLSFTDCTTIAISKEYKIQYIATFDDGFNQFGREFGIVR